MTHPATAARRVATSRACRLAAAGLASLGALAGGRLAAAPAPTADSAPAGTSITWQRLGPGGGGWIQAIACDPREADVLYVGCDVGGFYLSTDAGRHYEIRNTGLRDYFVECIAVHPRDSRTLLLGTEGGVYRTTDQGRTWQACRGGFPGIQRYSFSAPVACLVYHPADPQTVLAGLGRPRAAKDGRGTILRSTDGGSTWAAVTPGQLPADAIVSDLEALATQPPVFLAATTHGVFRSADDGATWTAANAGLPHTYAEELAASASAPQVVYCSLRTTARDAEPWNGGVFRSDDAGLHWEARNGGLPTRVGKTGESSYMTSNVKELVVDPRNPDTVYAGNRSWVTAGVYKTTDGGRSWASASNHRADGGNMNYGWIRQWGPSVECMAISPIRPERVVFGTSGQVYLTDDGGASWDQRYCQEFPDGRFAGTGLEVTCAHDAVGDPRRPDRLFLAYADIGLLVSDDRGTTFRRSSRGMKHDGNTFSVLIDPDAPDTLWAGTGQWATNTGDVCRSDDGGATWKVVGTPETGLPDAQVRHLVLDRTSPVGQRRLLVTSGGHGVFASRDGGTSWQAANGDLPDGAAASPAGLLLDPVDGQHLRLAVSGSPARGGGLYETRDGGRTWQRVGDASGVGEIQAVATAPGAPDTLYLAARELYDRAVTPPVMRPGGVFRSTDGGRTWERVLDYHFVSSVAVNPRDPRTVYAGTNDHPYHDVCVAEGVLVSRDGGTTWTRESTGLSDLNVAFVRVDPRDPAVVYAGTGGNSVFVGRDTGRAAAKP